MALANYQVAKSLYEQAVGGNVTAAIWWTKARMGWSETVIQQKESHEHRYDSMSTENIVKELEKRANRLGVKVDLRIG